MRSSLDVPLVPLAEESAEEDPCGRDALRIRTLVQEQFQFVWRCLRRLGVPESSVDDAAQQVFLVAARKLGSIEPGLERAFLFGTSSRVASDYRRAHERADARRAGQGAIDTAPDRAPDPERALVTACRRAMLDEVLLTMPEEIRAVFVLYELEGLTVPEVAAATGVPLGTATSRLRRGRELFHEGAARLRARLQREDAGR